MKKVLFIAFVGLLSACSAPSDSKQNIAKETDSLNEDRLEVFAFHGTRQCTTCKNMKSKTKASLEKFYQKELKDGSIVYQVIDVDDEKNYELAEKFEASGTGLMINKVKKGKDNIEDWSDFAFEFANGEQADYERELKRMIDEQLK
jgi:thioredoxin-related protein